MSKPISRLWFLGPPAAILLSGLVYYAKFNSVRRWVDTRFPWVEDHVGSHLPPLADESRAASPPRRVATPAPPPNPSEPAPDPQRSIAPPAAPSFLTPDGRVDMTKLTANRSAWPPAVALKTAKEFPAVVNGKVVGRVEVPAGTEARLISVQDGKLGVEYRGGGAWLTVEETDLAQRLRR